MASQPPIHTPLVDKQNPTGVPSIWARFWGNLLSIGKPGIGDGANANEYRPLRLERAQGPANPHQLVATFRQVTLSGTDGKPQVFWAAFYQ